VCCGARENLGESRLGQSPAVFVEDPRLAVGDDYAALFDKVLDLLGLDRR
jgi:hypothetical protein